MLTNRRADILRFIVDEYVDSAQPVGSATVVDKYSLPVSSATIRKEMVRLEEEGYILQPHTSAGRVPSDKGYRYYLEWLMPEEELQRDVKGMIRHQFQAARELAEWIRLAATILASQVHSMAVVTAPRSARGRLRWLSLVSLHDFLVLLIVVLQEARIRQQVLSLTEQLGSEALTAIAQRLNRMFSGLTAEEIEQRSQELPALEQQVMRAVSDLLEAEDTLSYEPAVLGGLRDILRQPEFVESDKILNLLDIFDERNLRRVFPMANVSEDAVTVIIGQEHPDDAMHPYSLVMSRYGEVTGARGALAIIGPTRLRYARAVATVRYIASLLDELMTAHFS